MQAHANVCACMHLCVCKSVRVRELCQKIQSQKSNTLEECLHLSVVMEMYSSQPPLHHRQPTHYIFNGQNGVTCPCVFEGDH